MMMLSQNITALKSSCSTLKGRCPIGGRFQKAVSPMYVASVSNGLT